MLIKSCHIRACITIVVVVQKYALSIQVKWQPQTPWLFREREKKIKQEDVLRGARGVQLANWRVGRTDKSFICRGRFGPENLVLIP